MPKINNPLQITKIGKRTIVSDNSGSILYDLRSNEEPNLNAQLRKSKQEANIKINSGKNFKSINKDTYQFSDVIDTGERKAKLQYNKGDKNLNIQQRKRQVIEIGKNNEKDLLAYGKQGDFAFSARKISPNVNRQITERSGIDFTEIS